MQARMFKFPHIDQYHQAVGALKLRSQYVGNDADGAPIYGETRPLGAYEFTGTVKLHGANTAVCDSGDNRWAQCRNNVLTPDFKHFGFQEFLAQNQEAFDDLFEKVRELTGPADCHIIYGEWCGKGINKGTAIHKLDLLYAIFGLAAVRDGGRTYYGKSFIEQLACREKRIFNVYDFGTFRAVVDLNDPGKSAETISAITEEVGKSCPAGRYFGVDGKGEGLVWTLEMPDQIVRFKTKIDEFNVVQKPKAPKEKKPIVSSSPEEIESIRKFIEYAVTENRLEQGLQEVCQGEPETKHTGDFIGWMLRDVMREENETIETNGLDKKKLSQEIKTIARKYIENLIASRKAANER